MNEIYYSLGVVSHTHAHVKLHQCCPVPHPSAGIGVGHSQLQELSFHLEVFLNKKYHMLNIINIILRKKNHSRLNTRTSTIRFTWTTIALTFSWKPCLWTASTSWHSHSTRTFTLASIPVVLLFVRACWVSNTTSACTSFSVIGLWLITRYFKTRKV